MRKSFLIIIYVFIILSNVNYSFATEKLRIISLAPSTTEILFSLGLDNEIVGVSQSCDYPPEAAVKEKIGTFSQPSIEKILSLKPDIIFCTGLEQAPIISKLRKLKLKVVVSDPDNMESLFNSIAKIGKLTGKEEKAAMIIENMKKDINNIVFSVKKIPADKRQKVFIEIWHNPLTTAGKGSFVDELITLAGGINIASDLKSAYGSFSSECVIKRNPDCIILAYMGNENFSDNIKTRCGWENISAVRNNKVFNDIDPNILLRPGPRVSAGVKAIYKKLYE